MDTSAAELFKIKKLEELQDCIRKARASVGTGTEVEKLVPYDQASISKFENGRRKPSLEYLRTLAQIAKVSYLEEMRWLGMAGYLPWTRMPSQERIPQELE